MLGGWNSQNILPTMVHGPALYIICNLTTPHREGSPLSTTWGHAEQLCRLEPWVSSPVPSYMRTEWFSLQYSWQHTLINVEHLKGSAFNAEVSLEVVNHGLIISFITLTCTDGQQLNKQYDHNDFQVDVPDSIGISKN